MGQDVDSALRQIATTRATLERDIDELFGRLPEPAALAHQAKRYGAVAIGAAATLGIVAVRARSSAQQRARRMDARIHAEELARAFSPQPPADTDDDSSGRGPFLAGLVALVAVVLVVLNGRRGD